MSVTVHITWSTYKHGKGYLARITGADRRYGFAREFVPAVEREQSRSGATGQATYALTEPGIYERGNTRGERDRHAYFAYDGEQCTEVTYAEVADAVAEYATEQANDTAGGAA